MKDINLAAPNWEVVNYVLDVAEYWISDMDIDEIYRGIGELGRQQQKYIASILLVNTYAAFHMLQVG